MNRVLISDPLSEEGIRPLLDAEDVEAIADPSLSHEELLEAVSTSHALIVRSQTQVTREVIENAPHLKVIGRAGVGVDNIDLDAATEHGVVVVNAPDGNTISAAEHTMAMMMSLARNIPQAYHQLKQNRWERKQFIGVELKNKTLGLVGFGRIGNEVAQRAKGHHMNVIAYDPFLNKEKAEKAGVNQGTLQEVLQQADFLSVHTPLMEETKHLIDREAIQLMKPGARILNCARGGIINEDALYDGIKSGKIAGAALDVFEEEPAIDHPLLSLNEVIATPHLGASTVEAQENVATDVSYDVLELLRGGTVRHPVNMPSVSSDMMEKLSPYFQLAERLGAFLSRIVDGALERVNIYYSGDLLDADTMPLTRIAVKGIMQRYIGNRVNDVNAFKTASDKGIIINEQKSTSTKGFTNLMTVEMETDQGKRNISGTLLNGLGARIVQLDQYSIDVVPDGHLIVIHHKDQPGAIGRVGNLLAGHHMNIATMQVGRANQGGDAVMVLTVDKDVSAECQEELTQLADIKRVQCLTLS